MALVKTKELHKQLDEMKPNANFSSSVPRPMELNNKPFTVIN